MVLSTDRGPDILRRAWESYKEALKEGADRMEWLAARWFSFITWLKFHNRDGERAWFDMDTLTLHVEGGDRDAEEVGELRMTIGYSGAFLALMSVFAVYWLQFDFFGAGTNPSRGDMLRVGVTLVAMWTAFLSLHFVDKVTIEREGDD